MTEHPPKRHGDMSLFLVAFIATVIIVGIHSLQFSHEIREPDEAAYAYIGESVRLGEALYSEVWDNKPPGIYLTYAVGLTLTPNSMSGVRILQYLAIFGIILSMLILVRRKTEMNPILVGFWSIFFFTFKVMEPYATLTEIFCLFFITIGVTIALCSTHKIKNILAGIAFGLSLFFSHLGIIPILVFLVLSQNKTLLGWFLATSGVLLVGTQFIWPSFLNFYIGTGVEYLQSWAEDPTRWDRIIKLSFLLLPPIIGGIFFGIHKIHKLDQISLFLIGWIMGGIASIITTQSFFPHHFLILAAPLILLFSIGTHSLFVNRKQWINIFFISLFLLIYLLSTVFFHWYGTETRDLVVAEEVRKIVQQEEDLWVVGYMPEIYWYSHRRNHLPFFHTLILIDHRMNPIRPELMPRVQSYFDAFPPKYVVLQSPVFITHPDLDSLLCHYAPIKENWLFQRVEKEVTEPRACESHTIINEKIRDMI
ncbi:MAG: hypothetical protein V1776_01445 [Candidatus Diapherotrites archaeon]